MAKIIVAIEIDGDAEGLRRDIEADRTTRESWFSKEDGDRILVDSAYLNEARADDSFYAFEFRGVEE